MKRSMHSHTPARANSSGRVTHSGPRRAPGGLIIGPGQGRAPSKECPLWITRSWRLGHARPETQRSMDLTREVAPGN